MIHVIAAVRVKEGHLARFIETIKENLPLVRGEQGCIEYLPAIHFDGDLPGQELDENVVTIIEKWQDLAALKAHLQSPHMLSYKEQTMDLVESRSIKLLREV